MEVFTAIGVAVVAGIAGFAVLVVLLILKELLLSSVSVTLLRPEYREKWFETNPPHHPGRRSGFLRIPFTSKGIIFYCETHQAYRRRTEANQ
jgi:hypothetical protein